MWSLLQHYKLPELQSELLGVWKLMEVAALCRNLLNTSLDTCRCEGTILVAQAYMMHEACTFWRHRSTKCRNSGPKSPSSLGAGSFGIRKSARMGCNSALGGAPVAICSINQSRCSRMLSSGNIGDGHDKYMAALQSVESKHWICPRAWAKGPLKSGKALA